MKTETPQPIHLKDYEPTDFLIDEVYLDVRLAPQNTRVKARLQMRPNPERRQTPQTWPSTESSSNWSAWP